MRKVLTVLLYIIAISLVFANLFIFNDKLDEARQEAYSEGYAAAEVELESSIETAKAKSYAMGYSNGCADGIAFARKAHKDPESQEYSLIFDGEYMTSSFIEWVRPHIEGAADEEMSAFRKDFFG